MSLSPIKQICLDCGVERAYSLPAGTKCKIHGRYLIAASMAFENPRDTHLGQILSDRYLIFDRIGSGGMGSVYKAVHLKMPRVVAIKLINTDGVNASELELLKGRFAYEAKSLSSVTHRNIVTVFDYGETDDDCYLVLEFVDGRTVSDLIKSQKTVSLGLTVNLVNQLLDALAEVHARGIVHRDIKPSNLVLDEREESPRLVLIDFGVAKGKNASTGDFQRELTRTGMAVGTPRYMSPEVLKGASLGPWSDLYAVGVLLYQMLSGEAPFRGGAADVISAHLRDPVPMLPSEINLPAG